MSVWENSYDVNSNSSNVGYRLQLISGNSGRFGDLKANYSVTIDGVCRNSGSGSYSLGHNGTITLCEGSFTIWHNDDGRKSVWCSATIDFQNHTYSPGDFYPSGNLDLSTIPRYTNVYNSLRNRTINTIDINWSTTDARDWTQYSLNGGTWIDAGDIVASDNKSGYYTISGLNPNTNYTIKTRCRRADSKLWSEAGTFNVTTYDIAKLTSTPNINIGSTHNITWSNPSGASISLKLCKTDNSIVIDYGAVTGTSKSITPTASKIYPLTPNSNTYKARYIITTTANGKSYTNYKDFTFNVTNSNPIFENFTFQDINTNIVNLTGNNQILVTNYSNVKATVSTDNKAVSQNSSIMKTYKLTIGNKNTSSAYKENENINLSINQVDNNVINLYAIDSRGNSTKLSKIATVKDYKNIKIVSFSASRENNVGTITNIKFEGEFWNDSFGKVSNVITSCKYKYKKTSNSEWIEGKTTITYSISGNKVLGNLNIQGDKGTDGFSADSSYNIQLILSDKLSSTTYEIILSSGNPAISIYGNNVAIGKQYDTNIGKQLQIKGGTHLSNDTDDVFYQVQRTDTSIQMGVGIDKDGIKHGIWSDTLNKWLIYGDKEKIYIDDIDVLNIQHKPVILYDNESGTTGTVTLSESAANFNYLEIYAGRMYWQYCTKIQHPNNTKTNLVTAYSEVNNKTFYTYCKCIQISGTSIITNYSQIQFTPNDGTPNVGADDSYKIFKVVGYRKEA